MAWCLVLGGVMEEERAGSNGDSSETHKRIRLCPWGGHGAFLEKQASRPQTPFLPYHLFFPHSPTAKPHHPGEPLSKVDLVQVRLCHQPAVGSKKSHLISLNLFFLVWKMGMAVPTFHGRCIDSVSVAANRHSCGATSLPTF